MSVKTNGHPQCILLRNPKQNNVDLWLKLYRLALILPHHGLFVPVKPRLVSSVTFDYFNKGSKLKRVYSVSVCHVFRFTMVLIGWG